MDTALQRAARHWSNRSVEGRPNWWEHEPIVRHVNRLVCGEPVAGMAGGDVAVLGPRGPFQRAVSVGCGGGRKEMALLHSGVVERFDLYEIAEARVAQGRARASKMGLDERITWHQEPMDFSEPLDVDLVYWNNALHHMLDAERAVWWSKESGRSFYMNDFVGPNRFQWPEEMLRIANHVRGLLGAEPVGRPDPARVAATDPTECADSEAILPAVRRYFPDATIRATGGVVYHLALTGLLEEDLPIEPLLGLDEWLADRGLTHYAVAN